MWAVGGIGTGLTETTSDMQSGIVLADTSGVLHAEQFGGSDDDYAYDTAFTSDGTFVAAGAEGAGCDGATKSFVNVFVRTMTQAPPISTTTTTATSAPSTPVAELR